MHWHDCIFATYAYMSHICISSKIRAKSVKFCHNVSIVFQNQQENEILKIIYFFININKYLCFDTNACVL